MRSTKHWLFIGQALILLAPFFYAWYQTLPWFLPGLAALLEPVLKAAWPDSLVAVNATGGKIVVLVRLIADDAAIGEGMKAVVLNPYTYSYGIPLFSALALASTAGTRQHSVRILLGLLLLAVGLVFSIQASLLFMFQFDEGFQRLSLLGSPSANDSLVIYVHFLGFRVLPRALPVLLWVLLYLDWIRELAHSFANPQGRSGTEMP